MGDIAALVRASTWPTSLTIDGVADIMRAGGFVFPQPNLTQPREDISGDYLGLLQGMLQANPVIFAAIVKRAQVFSQARFRFRAIVNGQPGDLFGTRALALLEKPEPTMVTSDLLKRALFDADLAGNWFGIKRPGRIKRVRPDWCWLVLGSDSDPKMDPRDVDAEVIGLVYQPGGRFSDQQPEAFAINEFAHFAPIPDPGARYRGMSWLTPLIRDVEADNAMTLHKLMFTRQGATPSTVVKFPPTLPETKVRDFINLFEQEHSGVLNAYRTTYLGGGADLTVVGKDLQQMDFKAVQGVGETRIAMASQVPAVILGISEGLQGSSLNSGNYNSAKRNFADTTMRDLWGTMASSLESIMPPPGDSELWYDAANIPFLAEDAKDAAEVLSLKMQAIRTGTDGGYIPETVVNAIVSGDLSRLKHSGFLSVQMNPQVPDANAPADNAAAELILPGDVVAGLLEPGDIRCPQCGKLAAKRTAAGGAFETKCRWCNALVAA